ncbi:hypothetical protein Taro_041466 [Colocasia esculenta]|uniref:Uncharacterized protein n=1 Tax=Colocasia esculenta TaxID=4460 RepID=A0A843WLJ5_COLES|nr:hypothetical protein [Colocasia esculenta]
MVHGARSGSSSGRRLSNGRGSSTASGASMVPEAEDAVSLQEGGGSFTDGTLRESNHRFTHPSDEAWSRSV